jgi:glycosyltransferase involved in cell wall biosynthesis
MDTVQTRKERILLFYGFSRLNDMLKKGNVWYVNHYETYFDKVYVVYLSGDRHEPVTRSNTTLVSLGTGNKVLNLVMAPLRLYRFARSLGSCSYLTGDQVFSWWTSWLAKLFLRARICLIPVCVPEQIYASSNHSLSGMPFWIERLSIGLSFRLANKVITGHSFGSFVDWLSKYPLAKRKLIVLDTLVESLPSPDFFNQLSSISNRINEGPSILEDVRLIYVGRIHREKLTDDLITMMAQLRELNDSHASITLDIIGDGPDRAHLEFLSRENGLANHVRFVGAIPNDQLPAYLNMAKVFVSPLTGTSLREAALVGLPIVAYDMDWISGLLKHEKTALLVAPHDYKAMACQVLRLLKHEHLYRTISRNIKELAWRLWSPRGLKESLSEAFAED